MQLKALIKNKAAQSQISAQLVMQSYMLERLLERLSLSPYRDNFILKGGFLIAAIVGLDTRATMDMDATVKGLPLNRDAVREIFEAVCAIPVEDNIQFSVDRVSDIRVGDIYPGLRVSLTASYPPLAVPLTVDITTGDRITPREIDFTYRLLFEDRSLSVPAYNLETILAEKLEAILSRNVTNTRSRDFYDVHILSTLRGAEIHYPTLGQALRETARRRNSADLLTNYANSLDGIQTSSRQRDLWERYRQEFSYAKEITFDDVCNSALQLLNSAGL
jgi:predicted nucleotidyltransferase component of viral defense system